MQVHANVAMSAKVGRKLADKGPANFKQGWVMQGWASGTKPEHTSNIIAKSLMLAPSELRCLPAYCTSCPLRSSAGGT